jgi:hypothetical protein
VHVDDPIRSIEAAMNADRLQHLTKWYVSELRTRLTPDATVSLAMTRWATRDLAGFLLEEVGSGGEQWDHIELPMLCVNPRSVQKHGRPVQAWARW